MRFGDSSTVYTVYIVTTEKISAVLTRKSPSFGKSYRTRNILPRFIDKSPSFGKSCKTRNILKRLYAQKSTGFGYSYRVKIFSQDLYKICTAAKLVPLYSSTQEGARHCRKPLGWRSVTKGSIYRFFELVTTVPFDCANSLG